jgi:hypothetical protein
MQRTDIESDVFHPPAIDLVGAAEVSLEHQLATARDQHGVNISARSREPIGHRAQRAAVDELVFSDGPAVVTRDRSTAAVGRFRVHRQRGERCQRRSPEK